MIYRMCPNGNKKIKQWYKNLKKTKKDGEKPLFSIIESYKVSEKNCQP